MLAEFDDRWKDYSTSYQELSAVSLDISSSALLLMRAMPYTISAWVSSASFYITPRRHFYSIVDSEGLRVGDISKRDVRLKTLLAQYASSGMEEAGKFEFISLTLSASDSAVNYEEDVCPKPTMRASQEYERIGVFKCWADETGRLTQRVPRVDVILIT